MSSRLQAMGWSGHVLGEPVQWPSALRQGVDLMLAAECPMWLGWGPELWFFGNDACVALLGRPWSEVVGRPAPVVWGDDWGHFESQVLEVMGTGKAAHGELRVTGGASALSTVPHASYCSRMPGGEGLPVSGVWCVLTPVGAVRDGRGAGTVVDEPGASAPPRVDPELAAVKAQLEAANARFDAVFDQGRFMVLVAIDGTVLDVNRAWLDASGFARDQVVGRAIWDLAWWRGSRDVEAWIKIGFAEAAQGVRFCGETRWYTADGGERRVDLMLGPAQGAEGGPGLVVASGMDVTEHRPPTEQSQAADVARETEARFRRMANFAPVLIWMADENNHGTWFNQQWLEFVGRPLERELGLGWLEDVHADDAERCAQLFGEAQAARRPFEVEFRLRRHDGEFRWVLDHGVPSFTHDGRFAGFIGSCIDITERKQAELTVQRLAAIVESSGDAILAVDLDGFVTSWNRGAEVLYGYSAVEIIGQPITVLIPIDRREEDAGLTARIVGGEVVEHRETRRRRRDSSVVDVAVSMSPIRDASGAVVGVSRIARDISERKRAETALRESEERFRMLADNIAQFAWSADASGRILWYNRRWFEYTGVKPAAGESVDLSSVHHPEHVRRVTEKFSRCIAEGEVWEDTFPLRRHDGVYRWFLSRAVPIRADDGGVARWFGTNTDITELREIEQELERARDEALAASRAKDDFLAALSHELRTPLNPVLLIASESADDLALPSEVRADFAAIRKHVSLEARLIDDLLDLTRISRGMLPLEFREQDVHAILRDALGTVTGEVAEKSITLTVRFDADAPRVRGDAVRLQQAFWNVLRNAVKFTPAGGRIGVATRAAGSETVEIAVTDSGLGMSESELPRIFDAFVQGDHASGAARRFGGLGLGLTISRRVIEMHGGRIEATSPGPGRGSHFVVTLPLLMGDRLPESSTVPRATVRVKEHAGRRILLVEDHGPTRVALERLLVRRGFDVISSACAAEARAVMRETNFDLLVSDIGLPDGNGCDLMRACAAERGVPGIALTGYGMAQDVARSQAAGFSAHLTKPISAQALDRAIMAVLSPPPVLLKK